MFESAPRPELLALLAAAKADPADDTPKLVLADWLQEQDHDADRARGEFVRLATEYHRRPVGEQPDWEHYTRISVLWDHYHEAWLRPLPAAGFRLWNTSVPACVLLNPLIDGSRVVMRAASGVAATEAYAWVAGLRFDRISSGQLQKFANSPLLDSLSSIHMEDCRVTWAAVADVVSSPRAAGLRTLDLSHLPSPPAAIAVSPHLAELRELRLRRATVGDDGFRLLCDSPHLNDLRSLTVTNDTLSVAAARALAARTGLPALTELDLSYNRLTSEAAVALANAPNLANLRRLDLTGNRIGKRAFELLRERFGDYVLVDVPWVPR